MIVFLKIFNKIKNKKLFLSVFNDISFDIKSLGYVGDETSFVNSILESHFGLRIEDDKQLILMTNYILKNQGELIGKIKHYQKI